MNKLPPKQFRKYYLWFSLLPILLFILFGILSSIFFFGFNTSFLLISIGFGMLGIALLSLATSIFTIIKGRKRFLNIETEIYEAEIQTALKENKPINVYWIERKGHEVTRQGYYLQMKPEGLQLEEDCIPWEGIIQPVLIFFNHYWYIAIGKEVYQEDQWNGILVLSTDVAISQIEQHMKTTVDDSAFKLWEKEQKEINESTKEWGTNTRLLLYKIGYLSFVFIVSIFIGVILELRFSGVGSMIGTLISVPAVIIGFPILFKNTIKHRFIVNKVGMGHAFGKQSFFLTWKDIITIQQVHHSIFIHFAVELENEQIENSIRVPYDAILIKKIHEMKNQYLVDIRFRDDSDSN